MAGARSETFRLNRVLMPCLVLAVTAISFADGPGVMESHRAASDFDLTADPDSAAWKGVAGVSSARNYQNEAIPGPPP